MVRASRWRAGAWWAVLRNAFSGPQVAAFLPALMLGAYWFGGEGVLLIAAVVFPAVFAFFIVFARNQTHAAHRDPVTGLPRRDRLIQALGEGLTGRVAADEDARIALITEIDGFDRFRELYGETGAEAILRQASDRPPGSRVELLLRPNQLMLQPVAAAEAGARVQRRSFQGMHQRYQIRLASGRLLDCLAPHDLRLDPGSPVRVTIVADQPLACFDDGGAQPPSSTGAPTAPGARK